MSSRDTLEPRPYVSRRARRLAAAALAMIVMVIFARRGDAAGPSNDDCMKCHGDASIMTRRPSVLASMVRVPEGESRVLRAEEEVAELYISPDSFRQSAHAGLSCVACHTGIERLPHNQRLAALSCSDCHSDVVGIIASTPHAPSSADGLRRPDCADCHAGPHQTRAVGTTRRYENVLAVVESCSRCHDGDTMSDGAVGAEPSPASTFHDNIHGQGLFKAGLASAPSCADCHGTHRILPKSDPESTIAPRHAPETCGVCHAGVAETYFTSVHGMNLLKGRNDAATCTSCHKGHGIVAVDEKFLVEAVQECSNCHIDLARSYLLSFHGKATELGAHDVAVCSSCHGAHDILPPSDPRSRVAPGNLVATCGKCHEGANANFVGYVAHIDYLDRKAHPPVFWTFVFMTTILLGTLAVFIPHTILWFQRTLVERLNRPPDHPAHARSGRMVERFSPIHRVTHGLIIISFMGLVATGFPLKYSHSGWAHRMTAIFGGIETMGTMHRIFAIITFCYVALHVGFLVYFFIFRCPGSRLKYLFGPDSLIFSWRDVKDFVAMMRWFFWMGPRPKFERWTYFEKFDYWGEIWGVIVIGGSGFILWMPTFFSQWLPGWIINCAMVVHSIEALLAASVIFLVHFFNTHLRPEKFPIDMVMLTGQMTEEEMIEERGAEYARIVEAGELESRVVPLVERRWRVIGAILGIMAFLFGLLLIGLAIWTEASQLFG